MNKRQMKKLYGFDFIERKVREVFPDGIYKIEIAFYDARAGNIGIVLNGRDHGYYDIVDGVLIF